MDDDDIDDGAREELDALIQRFYALPGGEARLRASDGLGWSGLLMSYAHTHLRVHLRDLTPPHLHELLFDIFPRRATIKPYQVGSVREELRALFRFARHELRMRQADECIAVLDAPGFESRFAAALADRTRWTGVKALLMDDTPIRDRRTTQEDVEI